MQTNESMVHNNAYFRRKKYTQRTHSFYGHIFTFQILLPTLQVCFRRFFFVESVFCAVFFLQRQTIRETKYFVQIETTPLSEEEDEHAIVIVFFFCFYRDHHIRRAQYVAFFGIK